MYGLELDAMEKALYEALKAKGETGELIDIGLTELCNAAGFNSVGGMHTKSLRILERDRLIAIIPKKGYIVLR